MDIFLSYRRSDSQDIAARLAEKLSTVAGVKNVFIDVEQIGIGHNFEDSINLALKKCDVCLVLVGPNWCGLSDDKPPRICQDEDYVRLETKIALADGKRVIPILSNGSLMPEESILPPDIKPMTKLNAVFLRHQSFNQDFELLVDAVFDHKPRDNFARFLHHYPIAKIALRSGFGLLFASVFLLIAAIFHTVVTGNALNQTFPDGLVWIIIFATLIAGAALPFLMRKGN